MCPILDCCHTHYHYHCLQKLIILYLQLKYCYITIIVNGLSHSLYYMLSLHTPHFTRLLPPMTALSLTLASPPLSYALPSTTFKSRSSPPLITTASLSPSRRPELNQDRRRSIKAMSRDIRTPDPPQAMMELVDESDFEKLISSENRISITGFGSLLSGE